MYYVKKATIMSKPFVRSEIFLMKSKEAPKEKDSFERMLEPFDVSQDEYQAWLNRPNEVPKQETKPKKQDKRKEDRDAFLRMLEPFDPDIESRPRRR